MDKLKIDVMLEASASYNDLNGTAQLAWHINEHTALVEIAKKHSIDTKKYTPIGLGIAFHNARFSLTIYLANNEKTIDGKKEVKDVLIHNLDLREFGGYLKDMDIRLFKPHENHDKLYQYAGEIDFENL